MAELPSSAFENVDLVTLSACETAREIPAGADPDLAGAEVDSLASTAQEKGAAAVLATLWEVSDLSTPALVRRFYEGKAAGRAKADALRDAQVSMISGRVDPSTPLVPTPSPEAAAPRPWWSVFSGCSRPPEPAPAGKPGPQPAPRGSRGVIAVPEGGAPALPGWTHPYYWAPFVLLGNGR
jgi:CHAT domain-containing protein